MCRWGEARVVAVWAHWRLQRAAWSSWLYGSAKGLAQGHVRCSPARRVVAARDQLGGRGSIDIATDTRAWLVVTLLVVHGERACSGSTHLSGCIDVLVQLMLIHIVWSGVW